MSYETQYLSIMNDLLTVGEYVEDRTGTGCYSLIGVSMEVDLEEGFPILTTKKVNFENIVGELLFFLSGKSDLKTLRHYSNKPEGSHTIWSDDAKKFWETTLRKSHYNEHNEALGEIYSRQWRHYNSVGGHHDQIQTLLDNIKAVKGGDNTMARRLIVSAWNSYEHTIGDKQLTALPACHTDFQVILRGDELNLRFSCRSNDFLLGNPYNITSYALLTHILAKLTGYKVGSLYYYGTDVHLYSNHVEQACTQLKRKPYKMPELVLPEFDSLEELLTLTAKDFKLKGYKHHAFIKAPQAS